MAWRPQIRFALLVLILAWPAARGWAAWAGEWFPSGGIDDPGNLVASELSRLNALPRGAQLAAGTLIQSRASAAAGSDPSATAGLRLQGLWHTVYPSLFGILGDTRVLALDLQLNLPSLYPRGSLLVPTRDWIFNLQFRGWLGDARPPGGAAGDRHDFSGAAFGVPAVLGASTNLFFRGFQDVVRLTHDDAGYHWEGALRGGFLFTTANAFSLGIDGGVTSLFDDWRWPLQLSVWLALSSHLTVGVGGGVLDLRHWRDVSSGAAVVATF
jgi:hypothetical protein